MENKQTINKKKIAEILKNKLGLATTLCEELVQLFFTGAYKVTTLEKRLILQNFGSFILSNKNARPARNLHTGETIMLAPRTTIRFVPAKTLKSSINSTNAQ